MYGMSKNVIGFYEHYMAKAKDEYEANAEVAKIIENKINLTQISCYDKTFGEHFFVGYAENINKKVYVTWNYLTGEIHTGN